MNRDKIFDLWLVRVLLYGVPFGVFMGVFTTDRGHVASGWVSSIVAGVLFGLVMGSAHRRQQLAREQRTAGLTTQNRTLAVRASRCGPIPGDPATRAAAAALTRDLLEQITSQRGKNLAVFGAFILLALVQALTSSPWFWLGVLVFAAAVVVQLREPRKLHRRLAQLHNAA